MNAWPKFCRIVVAAAALSGCGVRLPRVTPPDPELVRRYAPPGPAGDPWGPFIRESAAEFGVPAPLIYAVMRAESRAANGSTVTRCGRCLARWG